MNVTYGVERIAKALGLGSVAQESVDFLEELTRRTNALKILCARHDSLMTAPEDRFCLYDRKTCKEYDLPPHIVGSFREQILKQLNSEIEAVRNSINELIHQESQRRK